MKNCKFQIRFWKLTAAMSYNIQLKQFIFWFGKREFPATKGRFLDFQIGKFRYPSL